MLLFSFALFFCDYHFNCFDSLKTKSFLVIAPIKSIINWPKKTVEKIGENFINKNSLLKKNNELKEKLLLTDAKLQRLDFLEYENIKLRSLLNHSKQIQNKMLPAKVLAPSTNRFGQQIIINKGKQDKVHAGQPVLDAHGLLGQVISTKKQASKVLLVTNRKSAIPVMVVRNGLQSIAIGTGQDQLKLANIPETADVRTGDFIVTSNLGGHFPAGYHVGTVKEVKKVLGERFMKVYIAPKANIKDILHILIVWPNSDLDDKNNQFITS